MAVSTELKVVDSILLDEHLANTGYTTKWILTTLHENNPKYLEALGDSRVKSLDAKDISEAKGYMSNVFRVVIEFEDPKLKEYSFIMKVPTTDRLDDMFKSMNVIDGDRDKLMKEFEGTHKKECEAYLLIKDITDFPKVETYYAEYTAIGQKGNGPGVIMMEDLSQKATTIGIFRSVTTQHCLNLARHLGNFQSQIEFMDGWKGKYPDSYHVGSTFATETSNFFTKLVELYKSFDEIVKKMKSIDYLKFALYSLRDLPKEYNATTLCQGDCWSNNIMMCIGEDGSVMDKIAAIIDWQVLFEGSPMLDLATFMALCADSEIRRECERKAVDIQYDALCQGYNKMGKSVPYSREQSHELYDYAYIHQTYALVSTLTFFTLNNMEKVSQHVKDAQTEKLVLRTKLAIADAFELMEKYNIFERFQTPTN